MSQAKTITIEASLKRIAWAYGCAKKGSPEEAFLGALVQAKVLDLLAKGDAKKWLDDISAGKSLEAGDALGLCARVLKVELALKNLSDGVTEFCANPFDAYELICDPNEEAIGVLKDGEA